jgi:hypothetical protein
MILKCAIYHLNIRKPLKKEREGRGSERRGGEGGEGNEGGEEGENGERYQPTRHTEKKQGLSTKSRRIENSHTLN